MLVDQRRLQILEITEKSGFVARSELVERVGASEYLVAKHALQCASRSAATNPS